MGKQTILGQIKDELKNLGVEATKLENLSVNEPMTNLLMNPFKVSAFFNRVGIPIGDYGFDPDSTPIGKDFIFRKISKKGYENILRAGKLAEQESRAFELSGAGQKSIAYLYTKLKVGDVANLCAYEQAKKRSGIAA